MSNVFAAIQNRDAGALARMMGPTITGLSKTML